MSVRKYLINRRGTYYYRRRVPVEVQHLDGRYEVKRSTKCTNEAEAIVVATGLNEATEVHWRELVKNNGPTSSLEEYNSALARVRSLGLRYMSSDSILAGPVEVLVDRMWQLEKFGLADSAPALRAVLGLVPQPSILISELAESYFSHVQDLLLAKSDDQIRKYKNPRRLAVKNLIKVIGDKPIDEITRDDALDFREWCFDRVREEGLDPGTPNKNIGQLNTMINLLDDRLRLSLGQPFSRMRLSGEKQRSRPAFSSEWVENRLLSHGALDGLNLEARVVVYVMCGTGLRPSEIVNLKPSRMHLQANIPYVEIRADDREVKTDQSERDMPLVGLSLEAMRLLPDGFSRYRTADSLSATVNKYMLENNLRESPEHTLYSLRHTFKSRLMAIEAPERLQDDLMGHRLPGVRYGKVDLDQKARWLERISFPASTLAAP